MIPSLGLRLARKVLPLHALAPTSAGSNKWTPSEVDCMAARQAHGLASVESKLPLGLRLRTPALREARFARLL